MSAPPGRREKGGGEAQALGRSRCGFTTKVIAVACDEDGAVALDVDEGQRNDAPLARAVLIEARDAVGVVREVLGDKGFDSDAVRDVVLDDLDALPVIPNRSNRKEPWPWDDEMREIYKQRNRVERAFAKAMQFRRFATRYEKLKDVYLGVVRLVFGFIHVRKLAQSVNTP
ncbi:IS5 family transposase [Paludisphaera mucosa]|uniref:IS5 family transposase n=1 Tax=Paludisphaera mucosa TaxID=3030827 RepID=A0ABT6FJ33_9BACT|nr:IS5 family transposase [Paludisphaera mucosa]